LAIEEQGHQLSPVWRRSCLTRSESIADGTPMFAIATRFFDLAVVTLIFSALT
jgi:hypothetical protein